jgi:hypothetical protein
VASQLVASRVLILLGGAVNNNSIFSNVIFITISYPLYVSGPMGPVFRLEYILVNSVVTETAPKN